MTLEELEKEIGARPEKVKILLSAKPIETISRRELETAGLVNIEYADWQDKAINHLTAEITRLKTELAAAMEEIETGGDYGKTKRWKSEAILMFRKLHDMHHYPDRQYGNLDRWIESIDRGE